jgi:hypothetical protein
MSSATDSITRKDGGAHQTNPDRYHRVCLRRPRHPRLSRHGPAMKLPGRFDPSARAASVRDRDGAAREARGAWGASCAAGPGKRRLTRPWCDQRATRNKSSSRAASAGSFEQENSERLTVPDHQTGVFTPGRHGPGADTLAQANSPRQRGYLLITRNPRPYSDKIHATACRCGLSVIRSTSVTPGANTWRHSSWQSVQRWPRPYPRIRGICCQCTQKDYRQTFYTAPW